MPVTAWSVKLRPLRPGDEEYAVRWGQDRAFCLANGWELNLSAESIRKHQRKLIDAPPAGLLRLGIEFRGRLIGYVALQDMTEETGDFGIAIGESGWWGQGLGQRAGELLLKRAFNELHLRYVWAEVHEPNERSHTKLR